MGSLNGCNGRLVATYNDVIIKKVQHIILFSNKQSITTILTTHKWEAAEMHVYSPKIECASILGTNPSLLEEGGFILLIEFSKFNVSRIIISAEKILQFLKRKYYLLLGKYKILEFPNCHIVYQNFKMLISHTVNRETSASVFIFVASREN